MPYRSVFVPGLFDGRTVLVTGGGSGLGRCVAHELAALGAGVALVGRTAEKLAAVAGEIRADGGSATTAREVPLRRFGTEAEVSAAVVFLLSPAASFVTGTCLRVDGGVPNNRPGWWELTDPVRGERFDGFHRSRPPGLLDH